MDKSPMEQKGNQISNRLHCHQERRRTIGLWRHLHLRIVLWFGCGFLFSFFLFSCFFFFLLLLVFIVSLGAVFCCFRVAGRILAFPVDWATAPILIEVLSAGAGDWALVPWFCFGSPVGKAAFVSVFAVYTGIVYAFSFVSGFCFL